MKKGLSLGQVGQRPFEMGYETMGFLYEIVTEKKNPADPDLHRPGCLHAQDRRHLHRQLSIA